MNTKALRQKILDLAIRGKLVPQDLNDEPASVLLERIREEKRQMVKDGKLKAKDIKNDTVIFKGEDNLHYEKFQDGTVKCIEDEIPFEVPEGWEWCRVRNIASVKGGKRLPKGMTFSDIITNHAYIRVTDMKNCSINATGLKYISDETFESISAYTISKDDLYVTIAGTIGVVGEVPDVLDGSNLTENAVKVCDILIDKTYLCCILRSEFVQEQFQDKTHQVAMPKLALERILSTLVPAASIREQNDIAQAVESIINIVDEIEANKNDLTAKIIQLKSKILNLAIRGKLVPQDPNDEPASMLLERIRLKKEELIKQGKLKRDKDDSVIYRGDDNSYYEKFGDGTIVNIQNELPFDIPDSWEWIKLSSLTIKEIKRGKTPKYTEKSNTLVFAQKCNLKKGGIDYRLSQYLNEDILSKYDETEYLHKGDIVINSTGTGTLGRVGYIDTEADLPMVTDSHVTIIRVNTCIRSDYVYVLLKSMQPQLEKSGEGSTNQKELKPNTLQNIFVPIPPIEEQVSICQCIFTINSLIERIENSLN